MTAYIARTAQGWITTNQLAERLGVSRLAVVKMSEDGRLPPPTRFTPTGYRYWRAEDIEPWLAANTIEFPKRVKERNRQPSPESLKRQYGIRRRFVELEGRVRTEDLAEAFGVSRAAAYGVLQGRVLGKHRYDRLQDDGLQPQIDALFASRRRRTQSRAASHAHQRPNAR